MQSIGLSVFQKIAVIIRSNLGIFQMPNHPNRGRRTAASNPLPFEIEASRMRVGLKMAEAAALVYASGLAWEYWESGKARMHPAFWELWLLKSANLKPQPSIMDRIK